MSTPLLPRLNDDSSIAITKRGVWQSAQQNTVGNLVSSLKVTSDDKSAITSIPDLWARPAMFEMVLFDKKHHLHAKYEAEWRGILAMLALREVRSFQGIEVAEIKIPETNVMKEDIPTFLRVAADMLPEEYRTYKNETGLNIQILTYIDGKEKRPLAIVWPTVLVCPAVNLTGRSTSCKVSWWDANGIGNPIPSLTEQEKALLIGWIDRIISTRDNSKKSALLIGLLNDYKNDLSTSEKAVVSFSNSIVTGYCECIGRAIKQSINADTFISASNIRLVNRRNSNAKTLLVMTSDLNKQWNKASNEIIVAGNVSLDSAMPIGGVIYKKSRLNNIDLTPYNAELRMGDDFFTEKICLFEGSQFPNALRNIVVNYGRPKCVLLPIKKELLDYLPPQYILDHFTAEVVNDKDILVKLDIPLSGFNSDGEILTIQKLYKSGGDVEEWKREIEEEFELPLIQVWPNFIPHDPGNWQAYYSYYDTLAGNTFVADPLWKEEDCEVRELNYDFGYKAKLVKGKTFPEGYNCYAEFMTNAGPKVRDIGLILLKTPEPMPYSNNTCKIGIDFGTTNTVAYMSFGDGKERNLQLKNRLFPVTEYEGNYVAKAELRRHFFTASDQPTGDNISIRTLFNPNIGASSVKENQPVFPGVVYYLDGVDNIRDDAGFTHIVQGKDMKWSDTVGIEHMKSFLLHLGLACLAEAVAEGANNVSWNYSYPKVFNRNQIDSLTAIWENSTKWFSEICPNASVKRLDNKTESISMAEFFKSSMKASFTRGIACFDIGGGSTDIAIWCDVRSDKPKGQCSLKFAGNDILNKPLYRNRDVLCKFKTNDTAFNYKLDELVNECDEASFNMGLEALLKYHEQDIFDSLVSRCADTDVKKFIRSVGFALSGIFFYSGIIIGALKQEKSIGEDLPHCYVGGNGSKLLDWVANGRYGNGGGFERVLATCLAVGASRKTQITANNMAFNVKKSDKPKEEVAYGLVCKSSIMASKANNDIGNQVINFDNIDSFGGIGIGEQVTTNEDCLEAGEEFIVNGRRTDTSIITVNDICEGVRITDAMPTFRLFVNYFNKLIEPLGFGVDYRITFTEEDYKDIRDQVNDEYATLEGEDRDKITLEPPFIIILKKALDLLTER